MIGSELHAAAPSPGGEGAGRAPGWRGAASPLAVAAGLLAATGYVAAVDPNRPGHYPTCPFLALTGLYCPGCGTLRAVHALSHGHLAEAASFNILMLCLLPLVGALWLGWLRRSVTGHGRWVAPAWTLWLLFAVVVGFGVLRNLPGLELLAP